MAGRVVWLFTVSAGLALADDKAPKLQDEWVATPRLLFLYVLLLVLFLFALHFIDSRQAYRYSRESRDMLIGKLQGGLSPEQIAKIGEFSPTGILGTTRSLVTYALLIILGIAVFHLLAVSRFEKAPEYADKLLTVLAGSLASIVGFYFGSKATKEAAEPARQPEAPPAASGKVASVHPPEAPRGASVTVEGTGFGDQPGSVKFGLVPAAQPERWSTSSIVVKVPDGAALGPTSVSVNPAHDKEIVGSPTLFMVTLAPPPTGSSSAGSAQAKPAPATVQPAPADQASDEGSFED